MFILYLCVPLEFLNHLFSFLFGEFLEASCPGYMPFLVPLTGHSTQDVKVLGGSTGNSFSRMFSNGGDKMTAGGCLGRTM